MSKIGKCERCPAGTRPTMLVNGKLCGYHHKLSLTGPIKEDAVKPTTVVNAATGTNNPTIDIPHEVVKEEPKKMTKQQTIKANTAHIDRVWLQNPGHCENCGATLLTEKDWQRRAAVCHIIPKKTFDSVARHGKNRWFGCLQCHEDYDKKGWDYAVTMKVWPLCLERFELFKAEINPDEWSYLPDFLRSKIDENGYNKPLQANEEVQI